MLGSSKPPQLPLPLLPDLAPAPGHPAFPPPASPSMFSHGGRGPMWTYECCILLHCLCNLRVLQSFHSPPAQSLRSCPCSAPGSRQGHPAQLQPGPCTTTTASSSSKAAAAKPAGHEQAQQEQPHHLPQARSAPTICPSCVPALLILHHIQPSCP
jgi:hypothetical protein